MHNHNFVKILFVDDDKSVLRSLERIFLGNTYQILTATTGEEGLHILDTLGPCQIVISDFRMPVMDGVEFLNAVYQRWPETIRIILSGYADVSAVVSAINDGHIYKFVPKPWNDDELRITISNALEHFSLQQNNRELMLELSRANDLLERKVELRTAELELRNLALNFSQSMLHALPVAVLGIDSSGMIIQGNESSLRQFSVEGGVMGSDRRDVLPEEFNRVIDALEAGRTSRLTWTDAGTDYDVRFATLRCFDQIGGVVVVVIERLP